MSTFTVNISNTFVVLGLSPTTRWDDSSWDESLWDNKEIIPMIIGKGIKNTFVFSTDVGKNITRKIDSTFSISTDINNAVRKKISENLSVDSEMTSVEKRFGYWKKIYPGGTPNILEAENTTYTTSVVATCTSYTKIAAPTTNWQEV